MGGMGRFRREQLIKVPVIVLILACAGIWTSCKKSANVEASQSAGITPATNLPVVEGKKVCFVTVGDFPDQQMQDLVAYYRQKFNLEVRVLNAISPDPRVYDASRQQLAAEPLVDSIRAAFPDIANDPSTILIGLTTADMYPVSMNWRFAFGWRKVNPPTAVVSSARMSLHYLGEPSDVAKPEIRLRKMVTKDLGLLYYGLPQSANPQSVLYNQILGIQELDAEGEDF